MSTQATQDPLQILHVVTDDDRRGAQIFGVDLHEALSERGHTSRIRALNRGCSGGLSITPVAEPWAPLSQRARALARELIWADVAIAHGSRTVAACALLAPMVGTPFVARQVSDTRFWASTRPRRLRARFSYRRAAQIVALSERARADLTDHLGLDRASIVAIPNGVRTEAFLAGAEEEPVGLADGPATGDTVIGYVGALVPEKGVDRVIDAVGRLSGIRLVVVGDGPQRAGLEARADEVAPGQVDFLGSVPDPVAIYQTIDLLVLPSLGGDSMPAVIIEAGLAGVPTVATRIGSIPDVIEHGSTGLVVDPVDDTALEQALKELAGDEVLRHTLGRAARVSYVQRFDIELIASRYEACLRRVAVDTARHRRSRGRARFSPGSSAGCDPIRRTG